MIRKCTLLWVLIACFSSTYVAAQRGVYVAPRDLTQLTDKASVIFRGRVVGATLQTLPSNPSLYTVVVSVKIDEALKGQPGEVYTFRQFIWDFRDRVDGAGYAKGQELLLFMNAPNADGLSSPTGMQQGRFVIRRNADGSAEAVNGTGNAQLFRGTAERLSGRALTPSATNVVKSTAGGPVPLKELQQVISALAGVKE